MKNRRFRGHALGLLLGLIATGCQRDEEITRYSVPRRDVDRASHAAENPPPEIEPRAAKTRPERMLSAIISGPESVWFFKLIGPRELVTEQAKTFRKFVESVKFADKKDIPDWTLPEGWKRLPATGMRLATIEVPTGKEPLDLAVTPLKTGGEDFNDYVLANVDRWRFQMGLPPTSKAKLFGPGEKSGELVELKLEAGGKALLVDLTADPATSASTAAADPLLKPPVALSPAALGGGSSSASTLKYATPKGWIAGKADGLRQAAFKVKDGPKEAEITAIALAAAAGDLLANVNRWRDQVHLPPVDADELKRQLKEFTVDGIKGQWVDLPGPAGSSPRETILGVICLRQDKAWFFKMKGDAELVEQQRGSFETFVKSVKFDGSDGANHGH